MTRLAAPILAVFLATGTLPAQSPVESIDGLVAWYRIGTPVQDGEAVGVWEDSSGNGHDLVSNEDGLQAIYGAQQLNDRTVVRIGKANTHSVADPFELDEHTIFLVYMAGRPERALFQSSREGEDFSGLVLRAAGDRDLYKSGRDSFFYNVGVPLADEFNITVLGKESGSSRSFINGIDVSANVEFQAPVHVGRFFQLSVTRFVRLDGEGLSLAEMIFFDRYLEEEERDEVTRHLADKYGISLWGRAESVRRLGATVAFAGAEGLLTTDTDQSVNTAEVTSIAWTIQEKLKEPLVHDPTDDPATIRCTRDGTRVRIFAPLAMTSSANGTDVRFLVLKNNSEYLAEDEVSTGPMRNGESKTVYLEAELVLNEGDFFEVVTIQGGAGGWVRLDPPETWLAIEIR